MTGHRKPERFLALHGKEDRRMAAEQVTWSVIMKDEI